MQRARGPLRGTAGTVYIGKGLRVSWRTGCVSTRLHDHVIHVLLE